MKIGFYPKLAWSGIRKNRRLSFPYLLTCIGIIMMFYIIAFLSHSEQITTVRGGATALQILQLGVFVMGIFALIFLFYTNSFLIRRRKKEFGLYNILGMGKGNIARILFWESLIMAVISLSVGLLLGIILSKLAELCLLNILRADVTFTLTFSPASVLTTLLVFGIIFALIFLNTLRQIRFTNPIDLLQSENTGEKPPKSNWVLGLLGGILLLGAYYIAVTTENPIAALLLFFVAVIMVIIGTYLLFIAGSVLLCRILQKNKRYYYRPKHFVSLSSMIYRMKRNGAGLASICILATMTLVMISSTTSLYFGLSYDEQERFPRNIMTSVTFREPNNNQAQSISQMRELIEDTLRNKDIDPKDVLTYRCAYASARLIDGAVNFDFSVSDNSCLLYFIPLADYNQIMHTEETLAEDEVLIYPFRADYSHDTFSLPDQTSFHVKKVLPDFIKNYNAIVNILPSFYVIVPDYYGILDLFDDRADFYGDPWLHSQWIYGFDIDGSGDLQDSASDQVAAALSSSIQSPDTPLYTYDVNCLHQDMAYTYSLYGGLFFLGILLSIVFICGAVLIIYYKQVSEGYEDQSRFEIMQKVGMTRRDIRRNINSQMLTVFFLPLLMAGIHLTFAFPIITRLMQLISMAKTPLLALTTVTSFLIFSLFYALIYKLTSNSYYHIVV